MDLCENQCFADEGKRVWLSHRVGIEITNVIILHLFIPDVTPMHPREPPEWGGTSVW